MRREHCPPREEPRWQHPREQQWVGPAPHRGSKRPLPRDQPGWSRGRSPPRSDAKRPRHRSPPVQDGRPRCHDDGRAPAADHRVRPDGPSLSPSRERRAGAVGMSFAEREQARRQQQQQEWMEAEARRARQQQNKRDHEARQRRQREAEAAEQQRRRQQEEAEREQHRQQAPRAPADFEAREQLRRLERERAAAAAEAARHKQQQRDAAASAKARQHKATDRQEEELSMRAQEEHSDVRNNAAAVTVTVTQQCSNDGPDSPLTAPRHWRAPQPLGGSTAMMPPWVEDCYIKNEMAQECERVQGVPFLREGVAPAVGQSLYLQLTYEHDGSHPTNGWARMFGKVTHVCEPPEAGLYGAYEGDEAPRGLGAATRQLRASHQLLPALPPSLFGIRARCRCCRTRQQVVAQYGAVHGQRVKGVVWLSRTEEQSKSAQLGGQWDIELVCNDNLESQWVVCAMSRRRSSSGSCGEVGQRGEGLLWRGAAQQQGEEEEEGEPASAGGGAPDGGVDAAAH